MDAPYYNGGPDDYPFRRRSRVEREHGHGRCRKCGKPILTPIFIEGWGDVCSAVCQAVVIEEMEPDLPDCQGISGDDLSVVLVDLARAGKT